MCSTDKKTFHVRFDGVSKAEASKAAEELRDMLRNVAGSDMSIDIRKDDKESMDFGSTLVLVLGTPAVIAAVKGIAAYIAKRGNSLIIETADGRIVAKGDATVNIDVAKTVKALKGEKN